MLNNQKKYELGKIFLLGILTATVIFIPFIIFDRGLFLFYGDFNVQQIPFYKMAHEAIRTGNIGWSFTTDLGANFIGSYSFYLLGSPFFWITLLFPNWFVPYLMAPLLILKFGVASVTSYAYIRRFSRTSSFAMIGALMFAFCGFNVYNIFFNHFNEAVAFFPLLLISLEEAIVNNKKGYFALSVFLCSIVNYFFFAGQIIFLIIYFIIRCSYDTNFKVTIKKFISLAFEAILCVLGGMFLLLPSALALMGNPRTDEFLLGWNLLLYNKVQRYPYILQSFFFPPDIPARAIFFPDSDARWSSIAGFLPLFSMTAVIAFLNHYKKHWIKTIIIVCAIMAFVPGLNSAFYAFNAAYYARWFYMPILIMALATVIAIENRKIDFKYPIKITIGIVTAFSMIGIIPSMVDGKLTFGNLPSDKLKFWISVAISIVCIILTYILIKNMRKKPTIFIKNAIYCVCLISVVYSVIFIISGKDISYSYEQVVDKGLNASKNINLPEDEFYRIDVYNGMDNWPMFWNKPTIQAFHSVVPASILEFYPSIGIERNVASRPDIEFFGLRGLTSVKYLLNEQTQNNNSSPYLPGFEYIDTRAGFEIYENKYFIPMGYTYDKYIPEELFNNFLTNDRDKLLLKGIYLENPEKYSDILSPIDANSYISVSEKSYFEDASNRASEACYDFKTSKEGFSAKINLSKDNLVFFSVPYDKGWKAYINGQPVDIEKANIGFMAIKANAGENEISFIYKTPGLSIGIIISIISLIIFLFYIIIFYSMKKIKQSKKSI